MGGPLSLGWCPLRLNDLRAKNWTRGANFKTAGPFACGFDIIHDKKATRRFHPRHIPKLERIEGQRSIAKHEIEHSRLNRRDFKTSRSPISRSPLSG